MATGSYMTPTHSRSQRFHSIFSEHKSNSTDTLNPNQERENYPTQMLVYITLRLHHITHVIFPNSSPTNLSRKSRLNEKVTYKNAPTQLKSIDD
ncbi:hypothetical protein TNCV_1801341 [Trichonephila clavipes]|nr:hypothetical protein TNCV_1801341 [Trichonephila clavipes]